MITILSQDKTKIIEGSKIELNEIYPERNEYNWDTYKNEPIIFISIDGIAIGSYSTKERAKTVMAQIVEHIEKTQLHVTIINQGIWKGALNIPNTKIFKMPLDEEVE